MRIVCISDTHGLHRRMAHPIPEGDLLLHAGDLTGGGRLDELPEVEAFLAGLPHQHKIVIPGNHDWCFQRDEESARGILRSATCLIDEAIAVGNHLIWGSPWQPEFNDWAFNLPRGPALAEKWARIPRDASIVITHGPAQGILDRNASGESTGCRDLRDRLEEIGPSVHLCGHIHEAYGIHRGSETLFVNASICNLAYRPLNAPVCLDLPEMAS